MNQNQINKCYSYIFKFALWLVYAYNLEILKDKLFNHLHLYLKTVRHTLRYEICVVFVY